MNRRTMNFALPESMRKYIDHRVAAGNYGKTSECIRDLVRRDQEDQAKERLRDLIEEEVAKATNAALDPTELNPGNGSPTLGKRQGIPGLRTCRVARFPLICFHFACGDQLDVVRLLGERQNTAAILGDEFAAT